MICRACAWEADGKPPPHHQEECPKCRRWFTPTSGGSLPFHKMPSELSRTGLGSRCDAWWRKQPVLGHAACKGCDCRHQPVGSAT